MSKKRTVEEFVKELNHKGGFFPGAILYGMDIERDLDFSTLPEVTGQQLLDSWKAARVNLNRIEAILYEYGLDA